MKLVQIVSSHFVAGLYIKDGMVVGTAPILKGLRGWPEERAQNMCRSAGWQWHEINTSNPGAD
jgi:hypothetical protein